MPTITTIEGVGDSYAEKLKTEGISTTEALLKRGATAKGRQEIETKTGISHKLILRWVNMSDLFRIKGVGGEYAELLEAAGVDTVPELAQRSAANLQAKMLEINTAKKLVRQPPTVETVTGWVDQAKKLERVVTH